jgi:two-component system, OmpR family, response regulator QseB
LTRILIAEDEERIASFIDKGLKASGYATEIVGEGEEALKLARSGKFDLLILDLGLPGKDGLEVLEDLRGEGAAIPVVILTARNTTREVVEGLEGGADDYVTKPFRFEELLADGPSGTTVVANPCARSPFSRKDAIRGSSSAMRILVIVSP